MVKGGLEPVLNFQKWQGTGEAGGEDAGAAAAHLSLQAAHPGDSATGAGDPPHGGDGGGQEHPGRPVPSSPTLPGWALTHT